MKEKERADLLEGIVDRTTETIAELRGMLFESSESLRSAISIAERRGEQTNWEAFEKKVRELQERIHTYLYKGDKTHEKDN